MRTGIGPSPDCPIYCINLRRSAARRERMERRLAHHGLLGRTQFVDAVADDSPLVDQRLEGLPADAADPRRRAEAACLASHLLALRTFLETTPESTGGALICEDDMLPHNEWDRRFPEILDNLPADAPLCSLSYHLASWDGVLWAGRHPERENVCTVVPDQTWGAGMYWISRRYAATVLDRWDIPFRHLPPRFKSELIIQWSGGYLAYPPVALEDAIDSEIRTQWEVLELHIPDLTPWGYENFSACEGSHHASPLAKPPRRAAHRVKLIPDWTSSVALCEIWNRQSKGERRWGDVEITWDDDDVDYYAIVNRPRDESERFVPERTIVFQMEPITATQDWGAWASPDPSRFLQVRTHARYHNNVEWHLGLTYDQLTTQPITKSAGLSSVTSGKASQPGHRLRISFLRYLEEHGTPVDIFGWENRAGFRGYKGSLAPWDKRDGILPYRYTFAAENSSEHNYFTEKIVDAILGEALCFYWGCPNLAEYIDPRAFIALPLEDLEASRQLVERAMRNAEWEARIDVIRREKRRLLDEYQFFPTLARVVHGDRFVDDLAVRVHSEFSGALPSALRSRCEPFTGTAADLWQEIAGADGEGPTLVVGAGSSLSPDFAGLLVEVCGHLSEQQPDFDLVVLASSSPSDRVEGPPHRSVRLVRKPLVAHEPLACIVSREGAKKLAARQDRSLHVLHCDPPIVGVGA
jgi:hypothetical protein